ncbi:MAG: type II toxin-antitoxin system RelE/ParE family toxin [Treponema sp.]|nr:type II toxin-antitoxin system RelE/ParE family toxin [Treponema sp.]
MYEIVFYEDKNGKSPVYELIQELTQKSDKDSRINANKINDYIEALSKHGKAAGEPFIKHIEGDIWELRPIRNRIFFASWTGDNFILLHHFVKKSQKTPKREINQALRNLEDMRERSKNNENME